jgi:hypothetical protein
MVTGWPVAFACADADSVGLRRLAADWARSLGDVAWCEGVGALDAAWAGAVAASDPAARVATTAAAIGLDVGRLEARTVLREADIEVGVLRGFHAVPPVGPAPLCILCGWCVRGPSFMDQQVSICSSFLTHWGQLAFQFG